MFVNFNILNQLGSPAINSNTFANRPAAGQTGRLFVSTDTFEIYRDTGTTWDLIGGPGTSTITGTGTATQVAYFTSSQAIGSSANLYWDNTNTRLGIGTSTPGVRLDIHGTGNMLHINSTSATADALMSFQRTGTNVWRLGDQYNGGSNYFELHNTALANNAIQIEAATNKSILTSIQSYSTGLARGNYLDYTLSLTNGTTFTSPNTVTALGATLNLNIAGSATIPAGARSGADFFNGINFTSAGTFTVNQSSTIRAFSNVTAGWAFNGSAVGTVTHLAGIRVLFPTNSGSAINVTDNYALLLNDQTPNTGTVTYTNRWGIYQEGASDLNYMAANLLLGSTVNNGNKLQVNGSANITGNLSINCTLPAWSSYDVIQFSAGALASTSTTFLELMQNAFWNGTYKYVNNGFASLYLQNFGAHIWSNAPSGTAGNTITFTQAMTLAANGNLLVGTTTDAGQKLQVNGVAATDGVKFPATQVPSADVNTLDDYEESTWNPTFNAAITITGTPTGKYTKIGRVVYATCTFTYTDLTGADINISGLPFTNGAIRQATVTAYSGVVRTTNQFFGIVVEASANNFYIEVVNSATGVSLTGHAACWYQV